MLLSPGRRWFALLLGLCWLLLSGAPGAYAQPSGADFERSKVRIRALLGPIKTEPPAIRAEQSRLWTARSRWEREPLRFVVWHRIAINYIGLQQPDSLYYAMHRARHAAAGLHARYPLDVSKLMGPLGDYHWARQAYDSASYYYHEQLQLLAKGGDDTLRRRAVRVLDDTLFVGQLMARAAANTGLGLRRHGDLVVPLRYYTRALRLFENLDHASGRLWMLALLGEAYEEQGNDLRASSYYQRALAKVQRRSPSASLLQLSELLAYNHRLLLRQGQANQLLAMTSEGAAQLPQALADRPNHPWEAYGPAAQLAVRAAEATLTTGEPAGAALALANQRLTDLYRVTADHQHLRAPHEYYELQTEYEGLRAWAGPAAIRPGAVARALAFRDSVSSLAARYRVDAQLARYLLRAGQPGPALTLLREAAVANRGDVPRLRDVFKLQTEAYAALHRYDSAFVIGQRAHALTDTLRTARQYAALADMETHYRTQQKEAQISLLKAEAEAQQRRQSLAWLSAAVLAAGLLALGYVLRTSRRLNQALAEQRARVQEQADRLAEIGQTKSHFFANISHELRTPLTLVLGPLENLVAKSGLEPADRQQLAVTLRNGRRLQRLVNNILDLTKLEAGKLTLHPAPVRVAALLRQLVAAFESAAVQQQIGLISTIELPETLALYLDAEKVEQVVNNLLSNALKHTPAGGSIGVMAQAHAAGGWRVMVADTGIGIAPEEQGRVFERFYQSVTHQAQGGTGIGLALSRELAELMGGSLTLTSRPGGGSVFTFVFRAEVAPDAPELVRPTPQEIPEEALPPVPDSPDALADRPRLLVVEDNADMRAYLRQILGAHYRILEAENGRQAIELLATERVDLISSDEMMPEMTGSELLQHLKQQRAWQRVPFLMLTARADEEHRLHSLEIGVDDYLQKPFSPRELLARVHNLLAHYHERQRWLADRDEQLLDTAAAADHGPAPAEAAFAAAELVAPVVAVEVTEGDQHLLQQLQEAAAQAVLDTDFGPSELATYVALSERTLYRKLKEMKGLTPAGWLREVRLDHARHLLEGRTSHTVAEVAYAAGFANADYFGQLYYKRFGKRPSEYLH